MRLPAHGRRWYWVFLVMGGVPMQYTLKSFVLRRVATSVVIAVMAQAAAACSDSDNTSPLVGSNIVVGSGADAQTGVVGQLLATPITVQITDQNGAPMANTPVAWTVVGTGGTVSLPTTTTDASGNTSVTWTL